jgi:metal-sulfur cluster biosynthetic enzyme
VEEALKENIMGALEQVVDPELGVDIVNLGLVYDVDMDDDGLTHVTVKKALADIPDVKETEVHIVWNPPWTRDKMSRYAKIALGIQ